MDAFRVGDYRLLASLGGNMSLEFFCCGPHAFLSCLHTSTIQGQN
jgi:hypothetical protein